MTNKDPGFGGKVYTVSGSTQGVGAAAALMLARRGAAGLVVCGRNRDGGERVKAEIEAAGAACAYVRADLANAEDCQAVIAACDDRFGRMDGLVNAAGLTDRGSIDDTTVELWDRMFAVNARAPFLLMQGAIRMMKRDHVAGAIVNIITMSSHGGQPFLTPYSASKGALAVLTKNVAYGVRFDRIRVNGINIGWTDTPNEHKVQLAQGQPADWLQKAEPAQPFGRLIKTGDVAHVCCFLLGAQSGLMTGALIDYDQNVVGAHD